MPNSTATLCIIPRSANELKPVSPKLRPLPSSVGFRRVEGDERQTELPAGVGVSSVHRFAPQLDLCERLLWTAWSQRPRPHRTMSHATVYCLAILGRSLEIYDAVLALARTGRSLPALMLDRALFEDMVAAFWLSHPDNRESGVELIRDQEDHIVLLSNDVIRKYPDRVMLSPEEHKDLEARRVEYNKVFGKHGQWTWFGDVYSAIAVIAPLWERLGGEEEDLRLHYAVVHTHINRRVHTTASSLTRSLGRYDQPRKIDDLEVKLALQAAFFCLDGLANLVFDETGADRAPLHELEQESPVVFRELDHNNLSKVGRNEPCPCGSGKKFKHCHGA